MTKQMQERDEVPDQNQFYRLAVMDSIPEKLWLLVLK